MIFLKKAQRNIIALTLEESSRISNPFYLFVFTSDGMKENEEVIFIAPDVSGYKERFNIFELTEGENGSLTFSNGHNVLGSGESNLKLMRGHYTYKVYESSELVTTVAETSGRVLEVGKMVVQSSEDEADKGQNSINRNIYT